MGPFIFLVHIFFWISFSCFLCFICFLELIQFVWHKKMVWTCAHTLCNNDGPSLGWIMGGGVSIYIYIYWLSTSCKHVEQIRLIHIGCMSWGYFPQPCRSEPLQGPQTATAAATAPSTSWATWNTPWWHSRKYWLVHKDPYSGLLKSPYDWVV